MNTHRIFFMALSAGALVVSSVRAEDPPATNSLNHFSLSARSVFNVTARFQSVGAMKLGSAARTTPDGSTYNYDNGYVLTDRSGNAGGKTWNWGYDSASQIAGNTILMSRSLVTANAETVAGSDWHDANYGGELTYDRQLWTHGDMRFGLEVAGSYTRVSLTDTTSYNGDVSSATDAYGFTAGTTPPGAPYQGTFNGPGYLIGSTPVSSSNTVSAGAATITGRRQFDADVWGLRLGPYVEVPFSDSVDVGLSAGVAAAVVNATASWTETVNAPGLGSTTITGGGNNLSVAFGGYVSGKVMWNLTHRWSVEATAQYLSLSSSGQNFGGRTVSLDLGRSVAVTLGAGYRF